MPVVTDGVHNPAAHHLARRVARRIPVSHAAAFGLHEQRLLLSVMGHRVTMRLDERHPDSQHGASHPLNPGLRTVLVVDDNPSVTETLRHVLTYRGYNVVTASGGAEALGLANAQTIDGALIDVHMPGMNGIEVCRALRDRGATTGRVTPLWLITGAPTAEICRQATEAGALAVLAKPFGIEELAERLNEQFAGVPAAATTDDGARA